MKRITFLKSLLLAAGLMVGASAWGQTTTTLLEYGTSDVAWTQSNYTDFAFGSTYWQTNGYSASYSLDEAYGAKIVTQRAETAEAYKKISPTTNATINVVAECYLWSYTGKYFSDGNAAYFRFGNVWIMENDYDKKYAYSVSSSPLTSGNYTTSSSGSFRTYDLSTMPYVIISMEINTATNTLKQLTVSNSNNVSIFSVQNIVLNDADYTTVAFGLLNSGHVTNGGITQVLKSIKITETPPTISYVDYTINYKLGDAIVKTVTGTNEVGATITADNIVYGSDNTKYFCSAATLPSMELVAASESNVLNVPVRKAYQATLNVTYSIGGVDETPVSTVFTEADDNSCNWSYVYSLYVKKDNIYYKSDNTETFGESGSFTDGQVINKTLSYSNADPNVVYFAESESTSGSNYSYSNGGAANIAAKNSRSQGVGLGSLSAGLYKVTVTVVNDRNVLLRDQNNASTELLTFSQNSTTNLLSLTETKTLILNGPSITQNNTEKASLSGSFDYVLIQKISSMTIAGTFQGNWNIEDGIPMVQSTENPFVWTATVNNYIAEAKNYEYKATANGVWNFYELGKSVNGSLQNQNYDFTSLGAGIYNLTFTANLSNNTVELEAVRQPTATVYFVNTNNWTPRIWVWNDNHNYTGGDWNNQPTMTATGNQIEGNDIYSWSTYELNPTPTTLIISNNLNEKDRIEKPFVNGATYKVDGSLTVPATISASGYCTFATPYPLDLTGVTAYKATSVNGTTVHFEALNQTVPANTGVLLKGTANGTVNIPVASEGAEVNDNLFMVNTSGNTFEANDIDTYYYFGLINGSDLTFGTFNPNTVAIPANKAYLKVAKSNFYSGARLSFSFDEDTTTGITNNKRETISNNRYYNLNGQRVDNPTKGMYIVNGKKVIIK